MNKETEEGNSIIHEFMGTPLKEQTGFNHPTNLGYHNSWDLLMPVVEKISQDYDVSISSVGMWACFINRKDIFDDEITSYGGYEPLITNVFLSVVKFIKWHNSCKKN